MSRRVFLSTKFISVDGFGKIENIAKASTPKNLSQKKSQRQLNNFEKAIRFARRALKGIARDMKSIKGKVKDITWETLTPAKVFRGVKRFHLDSSYFMFMRSPKGIATALCPVAAAVVLLLTVCFWTMGDKPLTVNVDGEYLGAIENEAVLTQASASLHDALAKTSEDKSVTPVLQISYPTFTAVEKSSANEVYRKLVNYSDAVVGDAGGLYVDGVFFGAAENSAELQQALVAVLNEAKANYDDTTVTTFANDVQVVTDVYASDCIKDVEQIVNDAKSYFSVRLETDLPVEFEVEYETVYEYDDTQLNTYREVKVAGENGTSLVNYRLVYVDGELVDSIPASTTVVKETVNEVVVVGTQESYIGTGNFLWPVPYTHMITSPFEPRWGTFHYGIDIADSAIYGQAVVASDAGTVTWAGWDNSGYGNYVIIDHGNGYTTLYGHCSEVYVSIGDKVAKGDVISAIGSTGYSTGPHLHFEICEGGVLVDPLIYVS